MPLTVMSRVSFSNSARAELPVSVSLRPLSSQVSFKPNAEATSATLMYSRPPIFLVDGAEDCVDSLVGAAAPAGREGAARVAASAARELKAANRTRSNPNHRCAADDMAAQSLSL